MAKKLKLRGKDLKALGYPEGRAIGMAINMMTQHYKRVDKAAVLEILEKVLKTPDTYAEDEVLGRIAKELKGAEPKFENQLREQPAGYRIWGQSGIADNAVEQMNVAMTLPIAKAGALMPDAHYGYGLPIGGVLATENAIIPYGVGMDIGCRMCLSIYSIDAGRLKTDRSQFKDMLLDNTRFGFDTFDRPMDDEVLHRDEFKTITKVKQLKQKARAQIGSSGSGNHFVEFGVVHLTDEKNEFGLPIGHYVGVLSHSGSRGFGANIAQHYTKLAKEKCLLPKHAQHLAWLDLDTEEGMEYWLAMNLAGDYASACHHHIHKRIAKALGEQPLATVENHHNFAWKEQLADGTEVIVHRKGATPAGKGVLGIIPGSMTAPGFIVRGTGNYDALQSASHGAGRQMSRRKATQSTTRSELKKTLKKEGVELIGGGLDESPIAYKDIHQVMKNQSDLVDVVGTFLPKIVRMDS
ncbi:MAG: RtcB family protein [Saprospiraceae bacterium]